METSYQKPEVSTLRPPPIVMAGEGPPSTTCLRTCGKAVDADLRRHDGMGIAGVSTLRASGIGSSASSDRSLVEAVYRARREPIAYLDVSIEFQWRMPAIQDRLVTRMAHMPE